MNERVQVTIAVAMSESGMFVTSIAGSCWVQEERKHQEMLKSIREDKQLWSLKYIKTTIPFPASEEEIL